MYYADLTDLSFEAILPHMPTLLRFGGNSRTECEALKERAIGKMKVPTTYTITVQSRYNPFTIPCQSLSNPLPIPLQSLPIPYQSPSNPLPIPFQSMLERDW